MAIRQIREYGEDVLEKKCKPIREMTPSIEILIDDMFETMYDANGVGLAAPQVGILKRLAVIDCTGEDPFVFINPEILEMSGEQTGYEGCLSIPGMSGVVTRPSHVVVKALDRNMEEFVLEADDLLARAICHEFDHLDGHMYVEKVTGGVEGLVSNDELYKDEN
jgi:peptide deformylase